MLPNVDPYAITILAFAVFGVFAVQMRRSWEGGAFLPVLAGFLVIFCGYALAIFPVEMDPCSPHLFHAYIHMGLRVFLMIVLTVGVSNVLFDMAISDP